MAIERALAAAAPFLPSSSLPPSLDSYRILPLMAEVNKRKRKSEKSKVRWKRKECRDMVGDCASIIVSFCQSYVLQNLGRGSASQAAFTFKNLLEGCMAVFHGCFSFEC